MGMKDEKAAVPKRWKDCPHPNTYPSSMDTSLEASHLDASIPLVTFPVPVMTWRQNSSASSSVAETVSPNDLKTSMQLAHATRLFPSMKQ